MSESPDWNFLPAQPREFFGLREAFDRKDLKRAYNGLLRRYKPERFPAEFQRIRAAYEELEDALRYGTLPRANAEQPTHQETPEAGPAATAATPAPAAPAATPELWTTYAPGGANELQAKLEAAETKEPKDWLALALLREAQDPEQVWPYLETLLAGAQATQGSPWLLHPLWKAGREPLAPEWAGKFLQQLARTAAATPGLPAGWYVFATSPQWERLVQTLPASEFEPLLARCQEWLGPAGFDPFLVLRLRLLSRGALHVSETWRQDTIADIEEQYHRLPEDLQGEFDRYTAFAQYLELRKAFRNGSSLREDIDRVLLAGLTGTELEADRVLTETMHRVLEDRAALWEAFSVGQDPKVDTALQLLGWMANDAYQRQSADNPYQSPQIIRSRLSEFMFRLEREVRRTPFGILDFVLLYAAWVTFLIASGAALYGIGVSTGLGQALDPYGPLLSIVLIVLGAKFLYPHLIRHLLNKWDPILYRKAWRHRTANFMAENFAQHHVLVSLLQNLETKGVTDQYRLSVQLSWDPALELHSMALAFAD